MTDLPQLPRLDFTARTTTTAKHLRECRGLWERHGLEDPVLEATPLNTDCWATLFAYMHRRFGPPHIGGDDHKDLSAAWLLTSPDRHVYLLVSPSLSGPYFSFTPMFQVETDVDRLRDLNLPAERLAEIKAAYRATLMDLLRPVGVRDHDINALGELGDDDLSIALMDISDEDHEAGRRYEVERHSSSGYPMPLGLFGGDSWADLCYAVKRLGGGDYQAGARAVVAKVREPILEIARAEDWSVQRLMLLGSWRHRDQLAAALGLDSQAIDRLDTEFAPFGKNDFSGLSAIAGADVELAAKLLDDLGYGGQHLTQTINRWRFDDLCSRRWRELCEAAKDGFPDQILVDFPACRSDEEAARLIARLEAEDCAPIAAWAKQVLEDRDGKSVLSMILMVLNSQRRKAAKAGERDS